MIAPQKKPRPTKGGRVQTLQTALLPGEAAIKTLPKWGHDRLSKLVSDAFNKSLATFVRKRQGFGSSSESMAPFCRSCKASPFPQTALVRRYCRAVTAPIWLGVMETLKACDAPLHASIGTLYERTIDFGGHSNERGVAGSMTLQESEGRETFGSHILHGDDIALSTALRFTAQTGRATSVLL